MKFRVTDAASAQAADRYFNGFHDGFVRRLTVVSHDRFEDRETHVTTGPLDLEMILAHCNYGDGTPPAAQEIEARFTGVTGVEARLTGRETDWAITELRVEAVLGPPPVLRVTLVQPRLVDGDRWEHAEALHFFCREALFGEL